MPSLACARCGAHIATVRDLRFGLAPPAALCRACSLPAFRAQPARPSVIASP